MTFKEYIAADIKSVFINTDEYADTVNLDMGAGAKKIAVVVDNAQLTHNVNMEELDRGTGDIFFYVDKTSFIKAFNQVPREGDGMRFNVTPCTVQSVKETNGVLAITLSFNVG